MPDLIRKDFALKTIDEVRKKSHSFNSIDDALLYVREAIRKTPASGKWWIPVDEKLPASPYEDVLVTYKMGDVTYKGNGSIEGTNTWRIPKSNACIIIENVSAWMPLPKCYEG
jgi:hypothetical protein